MIDLASTTIALGTGPVLGTRDDDGTIWRINQGGFTGWGEPASSLFPVRKPRQQGAWAGKSFNIERTMTVAGTITAQTPALLNAAIEALLTAVTNDEFIMTVTENGVPGWVAARKQGETLTPKVTNLIANYSIQVVSLDSRKFGTALTASTFLPASTGGLQWPDRWAQKWPATVISGQVSLINPGNEVGPVVLRLDGPVTGPRIGHVGTGAVLVFSSSLVLGTGEWLTVDMDKHTAMANDQASRSSYITSRGWSGFDPGVNVWSFAATSYDPASKLTVTATPAFK